MYQYATSTVHTLVRGALAHTWGDTSAERQCYYFQGLTPDKTHMLNKIYYLRVSSTQRDYAFLMVIQWQTSTSSTRDSLPVLLVAQRWTEVILMQYILEVAELEISKS